jgi:hypothetical protein
MTLARHISICPISWNCLGVDYPASSLPLRFADSLYFADVSEIIREAAFDTLAPQFYNPSEASALKRIRYALVRHFDCEDSEKPSEDEKSANILYRLYLGLKVIRPSAGRYQVLHFEMSQSPPRLPRGSRNDYATILSDCDCLNSIRWSDLQELAAVAPSILSVLKQGALPISQAIHNLEIGYRADFVSVRHLLWVVGLDALFTSTEWENQGARLATSRITDFLGTDFRIYSEIPAAELGMPVLSSPKLSETLPDVYRLRNHFAHGAWPDKHWAGRVCRRSVDYTRDIYYSELLSEAASAILRGCLRKVLSDKQMIDIFNDKAKMTAHFASRGLVRKKRRSKDECNFA